MRLRLGGFSGRSSRKGSNCSTPTTLSSLGLRNDYDYPTPNFVRTSRAGLELSAAAALEGAASCDLPGGLSFDETSKLTIKLHYNPVMDEWVR